MVREQFIHIDTGGTKRYYKDREMKILHREDGPAAEFANDNKLWFNNGELHREDGPAVEYSNGDRFWYVNGKCHREDGPAIEWGDGDRHWYIDGKFLTEDEFNARMNPVELTLEEIAEKFNVSVDQLKIKK